jgi:hypothetical protein
MKRATSKGALATREAHGALLELRAIVEAAAERVHAAEFEAVRSALAGEETEAAQEPLQAAVDTLSSPGFEAALSQARDKMETALALHRGAHN